MSYHKRLNNSVASDVLFLRFWFESVCFRICIVFVCFSRMFESWSSFWNYFLLCIGLNLCQFKKVRENKNIGRRVSLYWNVNGDNAYNIHRFTCLKKKLYVKIYMTHSSSWHATRSCDGHGVWIYSYKNSLGHTTTKSVHVSVNVYIHFVFNIDGNCLLLFVYFVDQKVISVLLMFNWCFSWHLLAFAHQLIEQNETLKHIFIND